MENLNCLMCNFACSILRMANDILDDAVVAEVKCNVCKEVPREAALEQCHNGHIICADCRKEVEEERQHVQMLCPACRVGMDKNTIIINRMAEVLRDTMFKFDCRMKSQGCKARATKAELRHHEENTCQYGRVQEEKDYLQLIRCVNNQCMEEKMPACQLRNHVSTEHRPKTDYHSESYAGGPDEHAVLFLVSTFDTLNNQ